MFRKIAIVGAGQLAQMMARAGQPLGMSFVFIAEEAEEVSCVAGLGDIVRIPSNFKQSDAAKLFKEAGSPDVITVEKEHVDLGLMQALSEYCELRPSLIALTAFKNRLSEKQFLTKLNIPIADYLEVTDHQSARQAFEDFGYNGFLKSQEEGYDGYNQWRVTDVATATAALNEMEPAGAWVFEKAVDFDCELSFLFVCTASGDVTAYEPAWNTHKEGQLLTSIVPAPQSNKSLEQAAMRYARAIQGASAYVGVLSIECFVHKDQLLVNEIAPRVHNSGHWSMHGALTSQFANHVRAVAGLPPTDTARVAYCGMVNCLGCEPPASTLTSPRAFLYSYGKSARPRRKLAHVNIVGDTADERDQLVRQTLEQVYSD